MVYKSDGDSRFSEQIFEAIIKSINYETGKCVINPINANSDSDIDAVPIPALAGAGGTGIFYALKEGTRVIASFTSLRTREPTVILAVSPKAQLYPENYDGLKKPVDIPVGVLPYPKLKDGEIIIRGELNSLLKFNEKGDIILTGVGSNGLQIKSNGTRATTYHVAEEQIAYSSGGRIISGPVKRGGLYNVGSTSPSLFVDYNYYKAPSKGFFSGSKVLRRSVDNRRRNPELSEYRHVINEFSTDFMFTGFDDEIDRVTNQKKFFAKSDTYPRNRHQGNVLHLAEHELIEIVGGNLVDINGDILDLNYRKLIYGTNNTIPSYNFELEYDRARRISRRGVGYHFQLSTNTKKDDPSQSSSNFVFDLDKEGLLKINIPASSDTGNIPFPSNAKYVGEPGDKVSVSALNPSSEEPVPVTLRDEKGIQVLPHKDSPDTRNTGVRYTSEDEPPYFSNEGGFSNDFRINPTKYHNMYAAAERLIANTIRKINIPQTYTNELGLPEDLSIFKPFELYYKSDTDFPSYMSTVAVDPSPPAIYPGGSEEGIAIAGRLYEGDAKVNPPYSNSFTSKNIGEEIKLSYIDEQLVSKFGNKVRPIGGKSINANLEGSVEASVGKDNWDGKSIMLDTAGSIISWLGKDRNGRSMVLQTDGEVLFNIGGSYDGKDPKTSSMNVGRFELRVNVTDKGFVSTELGDNSNLGAQSDYIISISENGLVIAGMKLGSPMVIRNDGPLLLESSSDAVTLKGTHIRVVDTKGHIKIIDPTTR